MKLLDKAGLEKTEKENHFVTAVTEAAETHSAGLTTVEAHRPSGPIIVNSIMLDAILQKIIL